ncbi:uncharacterized protein LOC121869317 [Homarus americanus]|uniref:uncharacterized protein LOC121869317 n=1 Tax=Homarus americanus TaxID=6706 RepID=UPI001C44CE7A|nr:uncharacterized protein LOC121869317 [Homarus americanus]
MSSVTVCHECVIDGHMATESGFNMAANMSVAMTEHCGTVKYKINTETHVNTDAAGGEINSGVGDYSGYYSGQQTYTVQENLCSVEGNSGIDILSSEVGKSDQQLGYKSNVDEMRGNGAKSTPYTTLGRGAGEHRGVRQPGGTVEEEEEEAVNHTRVTRPQAPPSIITRVGNFTSESSVTLHSPGSAALLSITRDPSTSQNDPNPTIFRNRRSSLTLTTDSNSTRFLCPPGAAATATSSLSSRYGFADIEATSTNHLMSLSYDRAASSAVGGVDAPLSGNSVSGLVPPTLGTILTSAGSRPGAGGQVSARVGLIPPPGGQGSTSVGLIPPAGRPISWAGGRGGKMVSRLLEVAVLLLTLLLATPVAGVKSRELLKPETSSGRYDRGGPQHSITWGRGNSHSSAVFGNVLTNVTAVLGHRARLPCQVKNLGHKDVSWIRQRDLHILTVGIFTYTSDDRFKVFHPPEAEDWFLDISSVTFRDAGVYECQVSTSPKVSLPIHLTVLAVQEADILGPREVYIQHGSTISLHCEVQAGVEAVGPVRWLRGAATLNYSSPRGGISMEVEKTPTKTMSKLYITRAVRADSGNYTCAPTFARPDSVIVHVVNAGEESAAAVQSSVEAVRACMGVVWAATLLAAWLRPAHSLTWRP